MFDKTSQNVGVSATWGAGAACWQGWGGGGLGDGQGHQGRRGNFYPLFKGMTFPGYPERRLCSEKSCSPQGQVRDYKPENVPYEANEALMDSAQGPASWSALIVNG